MTEKEKDIVKPAKPLRPYSEVLGNTRIMGSLLASTNEQVWHSSIPKDVAHHKYVVWLGCQVLRTPQLAETLYDIFRHLRIDHASLGGPSSCCGIAHDRRGDKAVGDQLTRQTVKKFDAFSPEQMLYWCPSCDNHLRQKGDEFETATTKKRKSVVCFLSEILTSEQFRMPLNLKIALHAHHGTAEQDADYASLLKIFSTIPGLQVLPIPDASVIGRHCNDTSVSKFGTQKYKEEMLDWIARAREAGAQKVVSLYHSCHRQMNQVQMGLDESQKVEVVNYLPLIAESLGLEVREDKFAKCAELGDVQSIMNSLAGRLNETGLNKEAARRALAADFESETIE